MKTKDQMIQDIMNLEIEASELVAQAGGNIYGSNLFNQYLKLIRKIQKLRNKL